MGGDIDINVSLTPEQAAQFHNLLNEVHTDGPTPGFEAKVMVQEAIHGALKAATEVA